MSEPTEFIVDADVPVAVRDHGGTGPTVMLLHGAGGHLDNWNDFVPLIADEFRVVAVDLRCHGYSGDGPITIDGVLADLAAVRDHLGLDRFAVVGHSLGGMIAAHWAGTDGGPAAAISLDGHRPVQTDDHHYRGIDPDDLKARLDAIGAVFDAEIDGMDDPIHDALVTFVSPRAVVERDGRWFGRVRAESARILNAQDWFRDAVPAIARTRVPLLVVVAKLNPVGMPEEFVELVDALRRGLREDLVAAAAENPLIRAVEVEAGHGMVADTPVELAEVVKGFLAERL